MGCGFVRGGGRSGLMIERGIIQKTKSSEVGICATHWYEEIIVDNTVYLLMNLIPVRNSDFS